MKAWQKTALIVCCFLGMGISILYHMHDEAARFTARLNAPIHLNIEIDRYHASYISITTSGIRNENTELSISSGNERLHNVILHSEITGFVQGLFLHVPNKTAMESLNAIDGISIFIGNRLFYFSRSDIITLQGKEQDSSIVYKLPGLRYNRSLITPLLGSPAFINYYGDLNAAIQIFVLFATRPDRFIITWIFIIFLFVLLRDNIMSIYCCLKNKRYFADLLLLGFITLIGFIFRLNGYVRYSSWSDELYVVAVASNPALPFLATFGDPGNPPFYYVLLRFWFIIFGWTEQSARLFSVLIGTASIISLYVLLKRFINGKTALLAALYMAISGYLIGYSQEIRNYILVVFLVPIVVYNFIHILRTSNPGFTHMIRYLIPSILLVNTHYYGSLFVFANFLFFVAYSVSAKSFSLKNTVLFFVGNLIIAASLLPFFILTAFSDALLNTDFNTWISSPGRKYMLMAAIIPFLAILYIFLRKSVFKKINIGSNGYFIGYVIFVISVVFLIAFGVSMYRPILVQRYLVILYPLLIAAFSAIFVHVLSSRSRVIGAICSIFMFSWILGGYESARGGSSGVYHESLAFIAQDAAAHPTRISMEILPLSFYRVAHFYGYEHLQKYFYGDDYDVLYLNPSHGSKEEMFDTIERLGIDRDRVLKIHVNRYSSVFKIYSENFLN